MIKPFLTNKGNVSNDYISIKDGDRFIDDEKELVELFNTHYINIVEKVSGIPPEDSLNSLESKNDRKAIEIIFEKFKNHPSILEINKKSTENITKFELPKAEVKDINKLLKSLDSKKATGPDCIPPKIVKLSANVVDTHICNIINDI